MYNTPFQFIVKPFLELFIWGHRFHPQADHKADFSKPLRYMIKPRWGNKKGRCVIHRPFTYSCDSCVLSVASEQNSSACKKSVRSVQSVFEKNCYLWFLCARPLGACYRRDARTSRKTSRNLLTPTLRRCDDSRHR